MCLTCRCGRPADPRDDARTLTMTKVRGAADAAGISVPELVRRLAKAVESITAVCPKCNGRGYVDPKFPGVACSTCRGTGEVIPAEAAVSTNAAAPSAAKSTHPSTPRGVPTRKAAPTMAKTLRERHPALVAEMEAVARNAAAKAVADKTRAKSRKLTKEQANNNGTPDEEEMRTLLARSIGADLRDLPADFGNAVTKQLRAIAAVERAAKSETDAARRAQLTQQATHSRLTMMHTLEQIGAASVARKAAGPQVLEQRRDAVATRPQAADLTDMQTKLDAETDPLRKEALGVELTLERLRRAHERGLI